MTGPPEEALKLNVTPYLAAGTVSKRNCRVEGMESDKEMSPFGRKGVKNRGIGDNTDRGTAKSLESK